jgi:hypothetical protein
MWLFFHSWKKGLKLISIMVITHHHNFKMFLVEWIKLWSTFTMSCFCQVMLSGTCLCVFAQMKWKLVFKNTYSCYLSFFSYFHLLMLLHKKKKMTFANSSSPYHTCNWHSVLNKSQELENKIVKILALPCWIF